MYSFLQALWSLIRSICNLRKKNSEAVLPVSIIAQSTQSHADRANIHYLQKGIPDPNSNHSHDQISYNLNPSVIIGAYAQVPGYGSPDSDVVISSSTPPPSTQDIRGNSLQTHCRTRSLTGTGTSFKHRSNNTLLNPVQVPPPPISVFSDKDHPMPKPTDITFPVRSMTANMNVDGYQPSSDLPAEPPISTLTATSSAAAPPLSTLLINNKGEAPTQSTSTEHYPTPAKAEKPVVKGSSFDLINIPYPDVFDLNTYFSSTPSSPSSTWPSSFSSGSSSSGSFYASCSTTTTTTRSSIRNSFLASHDSPPPADPVSSPAATQQSTAHLPNSDSNQSSRSSSSIPRHSNLDVNHRAKPKRGSYYHYNDVVSVKRYRDHYRPHAYSRPPAFTAEYPTTTKKLNFEPRSSLSVDRDGHGQSSTIHSGTTPAPVIATASPPLKLPPLPLGMLGSATASKPKSDTQPSQISRTMFY